MGVLFTHLSEERVSVLAQRKERPEQRRQRLRVGAAHRLDVLRGRRREQRLEGGDGVVWMRCERKVCMGRSGWGVRECVDGVVCMRSEWGRESSVNRVCTNVNGAGHPASTDSDVNSTG